MIIGDIYKIKISELKPGGTFFKEIMFIPVLSSENIIYGIKLYGKENLPEYIVLDKFNIESVVRRYEL